MAGNEGRFEEISDLPGDRIIGWCIIRRRDPGVAGLVGEMPKQDLICSGRSIPHEGPLRLKRMHSIHQELESQDCKGKMIPGSAITSLPGKGSVQMFWGEVLPGSDFAPEDLSVISAPDLERIGVNQNHMASLIQQDVVLPEISDHMACPVNPGYNPGESAGERIPVNHSFPAAGSWFIVPEVGGFISALIKPHGIPYHPPACRNIGY